MKTFAVLLALTVAALCLTALPAAAADTGFDSAQLEPLTLMGFEVPSWMTNDYVPGPTNGPWLDCSKFTHYGCPYTYVFATACCEPRDPSPYTYCPRICA